MKIAFVLLLLVSASLALKIHPRDMVAPKWRHTMVKRLGKSASNIQWTDCDGTGTPYIVVSSVQITGNIAQGSTITVVGQGTVKQAFTLASADLIIYVGAIKLYSGNYPLSPAQAFTPGPQTINTPVQVPATPPSGAYKVTAKLRDGSGNELQCFYVTLNIA